MTPVTPFHVLPESIYSFEPDWSVPVSYEKIEDVSLAEQCLEWVDSLTALGEKRAVVWCKTGHMERVTLEHRDSSWLGTAFRVLVIAIAIITVVPALFLVAAKVILRNQHTFQLCRIVQLTQAQRDTLDSVAQKHFHPSAELGDEFGDGPENFISIEQAFCFMFEAINTIEHKKQAWTFTPNTMQPNDPDYILKMMADIKYEENTSLLDKVLQVLKEEKHIRLFNRRGKAYSVIIEEPAPGAIPLPTASSRPAPASSAAAASSSTSTTPKRDSWQIHNAIKARHPDVDIDKYCHYQFSPYSGDINMWDVCYQLIGKIDRVREAKMTKFSITVGTLKDNDVFKIGSRMTEGTPESKTWFNYMLDCLVEEGYIKSHNGYGSVTVS